MGKYEPPPLKMLIRAFPLGNDFKTEYSFLYHAPKTDRHSRKENKFMGETKQTYHFVVTLQELKQRAEK